MNQALCNKKLFVFDMDGTIYLEDTAFPFAIDFIHALRKSGRRVLFFTNNASHSISFYLERLTRMGFAPSKDEVYSSADVTLAFLNAYRKGKSVYLIGTEQLHTSFMEGGVHPISENEEKADIVVSSFDTTLTYEKLSAACRYIRGGAEFLSTHPDYNCPTKDGFIPDSGAIAAFITASTGAEPRYFGKPYGDTVDMLCKVTGVTKDEMCIFGDRLYTDIALGTRHGITSVLVMTGETTAEMLSSCKEDERPDFVYPSLAEVMADMIFSE